MCNDFGHRVPLSEMQQAFSDIGLPLVFPAGAPNLEPREDIWPTETAAVMRRSGEGGAELVQLRWGFDPGRPKAAPVINFRSEGRRFAESRRCLVPASHFFEFTGARSPKSKWRFTKEGEPWFCFAGLWRPASHAAPESFTILTTEPGPDVAPIHNRQVVVLGREDWIAWLDLTRPEAELLRPLPQGALTVEQVR
jgi:putative SOS response-associated peptidase YedK